MPTHRLVPACLLVAGVCLSAPLAGQVPRPPITRADSLAADSLRKADSIAVVRALEAQAPRAPLPSTRPQQGPTNPRLMPDVSAVGDLIGDLSPKGTTQADNSRFGVREVELAVQAAVDPYFRGDVFIGVNDREGVSLEQAYLTTTSLPRGIEVRLGRQLLPFGKENTTHRHDLHTTDYPRVLQAFLSTDGLKGTGVYASKVFSPFGFYQEVIVSVLDRLGEVGDGLRSAEPVNKRVSGLGYSARLRNYWDLTTNANFELSASAGTGVREQPVSGAAGVNAANARQSLYGVDATYRWRPLQQGLYKSFILQAEWLRQLNEAKPALPQPAPGLQVRYDGPTRDLSGWYALARYQVAARSFVAGRVDDLQDPQYGGRTTRGVSGYVEFFPSEFSRLIAGYERLLPPAGIGASNRLVLQATFALGPHRPHPF